MSLQSAAWLMLSLFGTLCCIDEAQAHYNLRTVPASPIAGHPFAVVFDDDECEDFPPTPPGLPPTFTVNGSQITLTVDRIEIVDCATTPVTFSVPVQGLPAGNYTLELVARAFEAPDVFGSLQIIPLVVGQSMPAIPTKVPSTNEPALAVLAALIALMASIGKRRL
jgi:hypothetical protein